MATQTTTQRKAAGKKAAATRKRKAATKSAKSAKTSAKTTASKATTATANATAAGRFTLDNVALQAERALLIPVGAALTARDAVVDVTKPFTKRTTARKELNKFERRGNTARNNLRREAKRTRTRVERELRQRRNEVTKTVQERREDLLKQATGVQTNATQVVKTVKDQVAAIA